MVGVRNRIASLRAGGPRQFAELRDKFMLVVDEGSIGDVVSELDYLGLESNKLTNSPIIVARPFSNIANVIEKASGQLNQSSTIVRQALSEVESVGDGELVDASRSTLKATKDLLNVVMAPDGVKLADFVVTSADFGPENLRMSPGSMGTLEGDEVEDRARNLNDLNRRQGVREAWDITKGGNVVGVIFDTGFSEDLFDSQRVIDEWHGEDVDSAYASSEGHGTMCAGAAMADSNYGVPYDGPARESDVILVRITDSEGQIRSDYIAEAWDWLTDYDYDGGIVTNHSYGSPICTGRPRVSTCNDALAQVIDIANSRRSITSVYAAGNEAGYCGRRPSGITNGITGHNSLPSVITLGAARYDMRDIQKYSSHGRGDCAPVSDPKPNFCEPLPSITYYGGESGWEAKDMSSGIGGSSGGTSHASPYFAGKMMLLQSRAIDVNGEPMTTEELKVHCEKHAEPPRETQISLASQFISGDGFDARFGKGNVDIVAALEDI